MGKNTLLGAFALLVGFGLLGLGCYQYSAARKARSWPSTQGEVIESRIEQRRSSGGSRHSTSTTYAAVILYEYEVDGKTYSCDRVAFGLSSRVSQGKDDARAVADRYPKGKAVSVYYDPENPESATLEQKASGLAPAATISGLVSVTVGVLICFGGRRRSQ